jgi:deoxyhypusine synthase
MIIMEKIKDYSLKRNSKVSDLVSQMSSIGFQASHLGKAREIIREMKRAKATVFLTFTANMVASGLRSIFARLVEKRFVDVIITTGGSIDHDLIRCYKSYLLGNFFSDDVDLRKRGINRIGNILVPNDRYVLLERKMQGIFEKIYKKGKIISPSKLIFEIGKTLKDKNSFLYWASRNHIPIFSPGITDSAIGLQTYFFKQDHPDFGIDVTKDMKSLADIVLNAEKTGGIILGGGISKHHALGVNLVREGFDYVVYVTTSQPWDGSLSGARTSEGKSWGKIQRKAKSVTIDGDATIIFPLLISEFL